MRRVGSRVTPERTYLGSTKVEGWKDEIHVYVDLRLVDDLNDHDRIVETVEHEQVRYGDVPSIAITWIYGTEREIARGDGSGGAGIPEDIVRSLDDERAMLIYELSKRWHNNTLRAGCAHQEVVWEDSPYGPRTSLGKTKPCPKTGYKYGTQWLVEIPPASVIGDLKDLWAEGVMYL